MKIRSPFISILILGILAAAVIHIFEHKGIEIRFGYLLTAIYVVINLASMYAFAVSQKRESGESVFIVFIMIGVKLLLYLITIASLFAVDRAFTVAFVVCFFSLYLAFTTLDLIVMLKKR